MTYAIVIALVVILALIATAWSPIFALIIATPLVVLFFVYVGMSRRADQMRSPGGRRDRGAPVSGEGGASDPVKTPER